MAVPRLLPTAAERETVAAITHHKDHSVTLETNFTSLSTGIFGGSNLALNRFIGPGRVGFQSMAMPHLDTK